MKNLKQALVFSLCLLPVSIVAGVFVGIYQVDILPAEAVAEAVAEIGSIPVLIAICAIQAVGYALFCGFFGHILANRVGLWKPLRIEKRPLLLTLFLSLAGGVLFSLDHWTFGNRIDGIQAANEASLTVSGVAASILYGGIIEEVLLRFFFLTLVAWVLWKVFFKRLDRERIPTLVFILANGIAAIVFAAGHLPATYVFFEGLTPLLLFRCFLLNGGFGLIFGWLYRKYGILYAMMGHALFHIVCKLVWIIFI